jgi:hypothetical protein
MIDPHRTRARVALGVAAIALVMLFETVIAHRVAPHPASPLIWSLLGATAVGALLAAVIYGRKARRAAAANRRA